MLKLEHIDKNYVEHHALKDINVTFNPQETTVIVDRSGLDQENQHCYVH